MAKKKSATRIITGIAGIGVLVAVIIPVMIFVFGVGTDILPPVPEIPEEFMIPIEEIDENNEMIMDQIINELGECDAEMFALEPEICAEDQQMIKELLDDLIILDPMNMTDFSEDPPITQVCDQLDLGCGSEIMDLQATITKIDSFGNETKITETFGIQQLAFLADPTGFDFKDGFLELALQVNTKRDLTIESSGLFDVFLNGESILTEPIMIQNMGITDENGGLPIEFLSPTGLPSPQYTFNFGLNFDKFINEKVNPLELRLLNLDVTRDQDSFSIINQTIITLDIERDDIKILVIDEEFGEAKRIFPTDSRVIISSIKKTLTSVSGACAGLTVGTAIAPQIGAIEIFDENGDLVVRSLGGSGNNFFDELVTRNANYTMNIFFPTDSTFLEYGKSQETKSFQCWSEVGSNRCDISCTRQVKAGGQSWTHCRDFVSSFTLDPTPVCNLP